MRHRYNGWTSAQGLELRGRSISNGRTYLQRMYPTPTGFRWLYALPAMSESGDQRRRRRRPVARITNAAAEAVDVNAMVESVDVDGSSSASMWMLSSSV